mmetsp:Transcript_27865/g.56076  ORF Transcript_27865/g.56076 Transcript_27865/m.56076 type:complete len:117 (-) Transcript_27865:251-601(-)
MSFTTCHPLCVPSSMQAALTLAFAAGPAAGGIIAQRSGSAALPFVAIGVVSTSGSHSALVVHAYMQRTCLCANAYGVRAYAYTLVPLHTHLMLLTLALRFLFSLRHSTCYCLRLEG